MLDRFSHSATSADFYWTGLIYFVLFFFTDFIIVISILVLRIYIWILIIVVVLHVVYISIEIYHFLLNFSNIIILLFFIIFFITIVGFIFIVY